MERIEEMRNKMQYFSVLKYSESNVIQGNTKKMRKIKRLKCNNKEGLTTAST